MPLGAIGRKFSQNPIRTLGKDAVFSGATTNTASSTTYSYTGSSQTFSLPGSGISISGSGIQRKNIAAYSANMQIKAWGAAGGGGSSNCFGSNNYNGGNGAFVDIYKPFGGGQVIGNLKSIGSSSLVIPSADTSVTYYVIVGEGGAFQTGPRFGGGGGTPGGRETKSGGGASWVANAYPTTSAPQLYVVAGGGGGSGRTPGGSGGPGAGGGGFLSGSTGAGPDGSGGGGGYTGGGPGFTDGGDCRGGGGGGGSSYVNGSWVTTTDAIAPNPGNSPTTVPWSPDPDYGSSAGQGNNSTTGGHGRIVIKVTYS